MSERQKPDCLRGLTDGQFTVLSERTVEAWVAWLRGFELVLTRNGYAQTWVRCADVDDAGADMFVVMFVERWHRNLVTNQVRVYVTQALTRDPYEAGRAYAVSWLQGEVP